MKNIKTTILLASFGLCIGLHSYAQDVHFSQMEYSPMMLNPGLAGANSAFQANVNFRSQWKSVASPYTTIAASVDARFNDKKRDKKGIIAGGINFFNDQVGDLKVTTNIVNLNLAYHLILDRRQTIGLGIYSGWTQRSIAGSDGRWGSQYDGSSYNEGLASGETFNSPSFSLFDAGTGLLYTYKKKEGYMTQNNQLAINAGAAFYHVNTPKYSFVNQADEKLPLRWSIFANAIIGFKNSNGALMPGVYFNRQKTNMEILYGTYYRIALSNASQVTGRVKPAFLDLGLFHRWGDALIAKVSLEWGGISGGFAYDINISSLTEASRARGGFEVFLRYNMLPGQGFTSRSRIR